MQDSKTVLFILYKSFGRTRSLPRHIPSSSLTILSVLFPGHIIVPGQLGDPEVIFALVQGLTPVTVHSSFPLPLGNFERFYLLFYFISYP